jgi:uncharacterized membrane protein YvlD (DUF360 family)
MWNRDREVIIVAADMRPILTVLVLPVNCLFVVGEGDFKRCCL